MTSPSAPKDVHGLLATLRDAPIDSQGASDVILGTLLQFLMAVPPKAPHNILHWFCHHASPDTVDAATFLIRLFAYQSTSTAGWKEKIQFCLNHCAECVQKFEQLKVTSRQTYFGAFEEDVLRDFYSSFEEWELSIVLQELTNANLLNRSTSNSRTLSHAHPAVVYRMVSNWSIFKDSRIQSTIHALPPSEPICDWPSDPLPPGMLILLMDESPDVRKWAMGQASKCLTVPMTSELFFGFYPKALEAIAHALTGTGLPAVNEDSPFSFTCDQPELWAGFLHVLRHMPSEVIKASQKQHVDLRRIVTGHVHDTGPHFYNVLRCLNLLVKRLDGKLWDGEGPEFPQVVFDSIKDNPSFSRLIQDLDPSESNQWPLVLFTEYLHTIRDLPVYGEVLAKMVDFLCEEMQHERFKDIRPLVMTSALRLLYNVLRKDTRNGAPLRYQALVNALDIHGDTFIGVGFSRPPDETKWITTRRFAQTFIKKVFELDSHAVSNVIHDICKILSEVKRGSIATKEAPTISFRKQMWIKFYSAIQTSDADGIEMIISLVAQTSHIDLVNLAPFAPAFQVPGIEQALKEVNVSLGAIRDGFLNIITHYADHNTSTSALDLLRRTGVVKNVTMLMLSPVEDIQVAAQILVGLAFDVDARQECFRALLENLSDDSLQGIFDFLVTFTKYAPIWPEACNLSKSLVRCFTDIIDVLCTTPNGLLHSQYFLQPDKDNGPASQLPKLWSLMADSLTVIFKRTPLWSTYFDSEVMIVWMRDALIFGRDMLAKWRVIESAANRRYSSDKVKPGGLSSLGKKMMVSLQDVLLELTKWLRLTDEELLHQSFSLLTSLLDCFRKADILPREENLKKLRKHIDTARTGDPSLPKTRLDAGRLLMLEVALDNVENREVVEIRPPPLPPKTEGKVSKIKQEPQMQPSSSRAPHIPKSKPAVPVAISKSSKSTSRFFTHEEQLALDEAAPAPTFRRSSKSVPAAKIPGPTTALKSSNLHSKDVMQGAVQDPSSPGTTSESEEDSPLEGLAELSKVQRSPKIKKPAPRRQIKTFDMPTQKTTAEVQRMKRRDEAHAAAARLKPDISELHKTLLSWDYNHTGPEPPGDKLRLAQVPSSFANFTDYENVFKPLLLLECWAQIVGAKEKPEESVECRINSRQFIDAWLDLDISIGEDLRKDWYLTDTDIVLLRNLAAKKCIMAKVLSYRSVPHQGTQVGLRCFIKDGDPGLQINTKWRLSKLFSLSTLHREFAALVSVKYYDFANIILRPDLPQTSKPDKQDIRQAMSTYNLNEPQANAILCSLQTSGFVLIQGPPGTGKTSTICGLVAASLSSRPRPPVPVHAGRSATSVEKNTMPKILICAPSNAAIDEIANRIKAGFRGSEKHTGSVKVVRIGATASMNASVLDISLDFLVEQKLDPKHTQSNDASMTQISALKRDVDSLRELIAQKQQEKAAVLDNVSRIKAIAEELSQLNSHRAQLGRELNHLRDKQKSDSRSLDALRRKTRVEVLREADVLCSTLSGAGHELLEQVDFEMVIIDEAAQAIELSSLIPLKYRFNRCIMVGDPQQLPPTVISTEACRYHYNESLFVRLQKQKPEAVHLLSIQYRMHPEISRLPSHIFYQGRLLDGPDLDVKTKQPWHTHAKFGTYRFFNVLRGLEESQGHSVKNRAECEVAVALYSRLRREFSTINLDYRVGVVSMYKAQIIELRHHFQQRFGREILETIDFNTVDGFQGQEKDVIILSCVRAGPGLQSVGFLSDNRRMNVALTRAKSSLFILGNAATLERSDPTWRNIVLDARSRSSLADADSTYFTRPDSTPSRPAVVTKTSKVIPPVAIPTDLATPRDFKTSRQISGSSQTPQVKLKPDNQISESSSLPQAILTSAPDPMPPLPVNLPPVPTAEVPSSADIKHPARPPPTHPRPREPLGKRPKQPTLFIPKRRPAEGNAGGPSNRRKL